MKLSEQMRGTAARKIRPPAIWSILNKYADKVAQLETYLETNRRMNNATRDALNAEGKGTVECIEALKERDKALSALEQAGVDNWSGYSYAFEILESWNTENI